MPDDPEHGEIHSPEDTLNKNNSNTMSSTQYQPYQRLQRKKEKLEHKKKEKQVRIPSPCGTQGDTVIKFTWLVLKSNLTFIF